MYKASIKVRAVANTIAAQINERYGYYSETPAKVVEINGTIMVEWYGPFEWTGNDTYGLHEELVGAGYTGEYDSNARYWDLPADAPVLVEAMDSTHIAIYED